jgi:hypothetical protein
MAYVADSPSSLADEVGRKIWREDRYHICYDDGQYEYWFGVESNPVEIAVYGQDFKAIARNGEEVEFTMEQRKHLFDVIAKELPKITTLPLNWVILPVRK